jgi:hypothetical protein
VNGTIAVVIAALIAALAAIGLATGEEETPSSPSEPAGERPPVERVARVLERVRNLEFERLPRVRLVSGAQARRTALRELDRKVSPEQVAAEERLLKLLGLLPADASLRALFGKAIGNEVGGFYLPRTRTLSIVEGSGGGGLLGEVTLAHELAHALEDQHFGIDNPGTTGFRRDRSVAHDALTEGTATVAMIDYLLLRQERVADVPPRVRTRVLKSIAEVTLPASSGLPRYMREGFLFPYAAGARLVNRIESRGGWDAVDRALGPDAPRSSEQIIHPRKYEAREQPARVRLPDLSGLLPEDAELLERGDIGEFDTEQLLREANGRRRSSSAATGWGGSTFGLWRLPGEGHALVVVWVWDSARDAREFTAAARRSANALGGAVRARGRSAALAIAPRGADRAALAAGALGDRPR